MTLKIQVSDGYEGTRHLAGVSHAGEFVVKGFGESEIAYKSITVINTAYNFFIPKPGQNFVMTSVIFDVGAAATVDLYESSSATSTTIDKQIFKFSLLKDTFTPIILPFGGFIKITEGKFLNAKTDVQPVGMTVVGFYRPVYY